MSDDKRLLKLNRFLASRKVKAVLIAVFDLLVFMALNFFTNLIFHFGMFLKDFSNGMPISARDFFPRAGVVGLKFFVFVAVVLILADLVIWFKITASYSEEYFNIEQKGSARWTTFQEIKEQYKEVPERETEDDPGTYPGKFGTIISRAEDKLYIDTDPVNNLYVGTTRSGKGEEHVFPNIDCYSRAEIKPSLIIGDPKMELYKSSMDTLIKRGYEVHLFNLDDPLHSMGYNPLTLCMEVYKAGDEASAELLINSLSYSIFDPSEMEGVDPFFYETAGSLLSALIIAQIEDCVAADRKRKAGFIEKRRRYEMSDPLMQSALDTQFWDRISEGGVEPETDARIAAIPPGYDFVPDKYERQVNMYSIFNMMTELASVNLGQNDTLLDVFFQNRPVLDRAKLKYAAIKVAADRTKGSIYSSMMAKLEIFTYENIAKMTAESTVRLSDIGFGDKPLAIFFGTPDYDRSNHFLASVMIRQIYFILAKEATNYKTQKCKNHVKFLLDEFGNLPAIEAMEQIITVCLGRNISFDLYIQSHKQMYEKYGDNAETIMDNCSNHIYIMTGDVDTAKKYSDMLGNETMIDIHRSGERFDLDKNLTEMATEKPLMDANRLMRLRENSCVIRRLVKRQDLNHGAVTPDPIYNSPERGTPMKRRYQYLRDSFPDPDTIALAEKNREDRSHIILTERVYDFWKGIPKGTTEKLKELGVIKAHEVSRTLRLGECRYLKSAEEMINGYREKMGLTPVDLDRFMPTELFLQELKQNEEYDPAFTDKVSAMLLTEGGNIR